MQQTNGAYWVKILRHCYYFEVSTPIVTLICGFTQRQLLLTLLSFPYYQQINLMFGIRHEKYWNFKLNPPLPFCRMWGHMIAKGWHHKHPFIIKISVIGKMIVLISAHMLFNHTLGQAPSQGNHIPGPSNRLCNFVRSRLVQHTAGCQQI